MPRKDPTKKYKRSVQELQKPELVAAIKGMQLITEYFDHLKSVDFYPHEGQMLPIRRILDPSLKMRKVFLQCSRNFGKTTLGAIAMVGLAGMYPRTHNYIIGPFFNLTREIYVENNKLFDMIVPHWLASYSKLCKQFTFKNGSFIKIDGADNEARVRGYKPHNLVADEFQDWKKRVWDAMEPNLLAHGALALLLGTPPDTENVYTEQANEIRDAMEGGDERYLWMRRTIWDNPRFAEDDVSRMRESLLKRGEDRTWQREYEALFIPGGAKAVYPMFSKSMHLVSRAYLHERIREEGPNLEGYVVYDPGGNRWGCALYAYNPYNSKLRMLDGFVETDTMLMSAGQIAHRVDIMKDEWFFQYGIEFQEIYDEAAKLFAIEMAALGYALAPTQKKQNQKSNNVSLVRDLLSRQLFELNEEFEMATFEFENYVYDQRGQIEKKKDELMDCTLYCVAESGYELKSLVKESVMTETQRGRRGYTMEEDFASEDFTPDFTDVGGDFLDLEDIYGQLF
jgi:hypothetical protein